MLEKQIVVGLLTIAQDQTISVREDTVVYEDGKEISRTYMRYIAVPGEDVSKKPLEVRRLAELLWTPEVVEAWLLKTKPFPTVPGLGNI
jgi:hypothetical protein